MILISPAGVVNLVGATFDSPDIATIQSPTPGQWTIIVDGVTVFGKDDKYRSARRLLNPRCSQRRSGSAGCGRGKRAGGGSDSAERFGVAGA